MAGVATKSSLSTESPPFNPNRILRNQSNSPAPPQQQQAYRSRSTSPYPEHYQQQQQQQQQQHYNQQQQQPQYNQQQYSQANNPHSNAVPKYTFQYDGKTLEIRNVWAENVEEEMACIRQVIEKYPYVAMDTEFPGVVAKPVTESYTSDYHYKSLKVNVDLLKLIQLGLSFADADGNLCTDCPCWQFNFHFNLDDDMFAQDSIDLLVNSGISFADHATRGIDPMLFGELLMVSGLVLDDRVKWVSFHSGYDFAYLLKVLTAEQPLPSDEKSFFELLKIYFPTIYDIKYMTSLLDGHQFLGGLQRLADDLGCQRLGAEHQAGSDSLLTMSAFFALRKAKFTKPDGTVDDHRFANELFGYGQNHTVRKGGAAAAAAAAAREQSMGSVGSMGSSVGMVE